MADVLIKGMEMPDMCSECDFCGGLICPDNIYCCDCPSDAIYGKNITRATEEDCRHPDCPLVPVPPHGRLIDQDAILREVIRGDYPNQWIDSPALVRLFRNAPTILPAEPPKEDE